MEKEERAREFSEKLAQDSSKFPIVKLKSSEVRTPPPKVSKPKNELERKILESAECGLSYGKYIAALRQGKTYEELKAAKQTEKAENDKIFGTHFLFNEMQKA